MTLIGFIVCIHFIVMVVFLLYKKYNPQFVLLFAGIAMLTLAWFMGNKLPTTEPDTGFMIFNLFAYVKDSFISVFSGPGVMLMVVGGFVNYMRKIGANNALVYMSLQPLSIFKRHPYLAAILVIPIGQLLFMAIPSATGLGVLLVATIFPVLVSIGISRISAVSVITACTVFDMGPASINTGRASELLGKHSLNYFIEDQLPLTIPLTIVLMALLYLTNKYFDKKEGYIKEVVVQQELKVDAPLVYAILPLLPFVFLLLLSSVFSNGLLPNKVDTTTAMIATVFISMVFEMIRGQKLRDIAASLMSFWNGMGKMFISVITLIVAADIFTKGLISAGFIDSLVAFIQLVGFGRHELGAAMTVLVFTSAVLTGSGSASFNAFAPLIGGLEINAGAISAILPMQFASSLGRAVSPISGVVVASSEIAKINPLSLAKRNAIPLSAILIIILIYYSVT